MFKPSERKKKKHTGTISELPKHQKGETVEQPSSKIGVTSLNQLLFTPALLPGPHFQHPKQRAEVQHSKARSWNNKRYQFMHKHENGLVSLLILQHTAQWRGREGNATNADSIPIQNPAPDPKSADRFFQLTCLSRNSLVSFSMCPS